MLTPLGCRNQFRCYSQRRSPVDSVRGIFCFVLPFPSCFFFPSAPFLSVPWAILSNRAASASHGGSHWFTSEVRHFFFLFAERKETKLRACARSEKGTRLCLPSTPYLPHHPGLPPLLFPTVKRPRGKLWHIFILLSFQFHSCLHCRLSLRV